MGITGSDVSKQAADMILLDDNFASIVTGIEEGRLIFDNLKKTISYVVCHLVPEMWPFILYLIADIPLGLGSITLLFIDLGTDIIPSVTLAYERAENDIMLKPPRDAKRDRLVTGTLLGLAGGQMGHLETFGCFFTYFVVMGENGFLPLTLIGIRATWDNSAINNLEDSYGQEWSYAQRKCLEFTVYSAYFLSIVVGQISNLIVCKTRRTSVLYQGMINHQLTCALLAETGLTVFLMYTPGLQVAFKFYPVMWHWWLAPVPFMIAMMFYSEVRKLIAMKNPGGFVAENLLF
jgi:sodium/potassium-transporting ATPase subunit alpha